MLRYFKIEGISKELKGCTRICAETKMIFNKESRPPSLKFQCEIKDDKSYTLIQPTSEQLVSFQEQAKLGNCSVLDKWHKTMLQVIEELADKEQNDRFMMNIMRETRLESDRYVR